MTRHNARRNYFFYRQFNLALFILKVIIPLFITFFLITIKQNPAQSANISHEIWLIKSAPESSIEISSSNSLIFQPINPGYMIPEQVIIRFRPDIAAQEASAAILIGRDGLASLAIHKGAVIRRGIDEWRPILGRFQLNLSAQNITWAKSAANLNLQPILYNSPIAVRFPRARFELQAGEAFFEIDGEGNASIALRKGNGWVKTENRKIIRLLPGKQLDLPRWGDIKSPKDLDSRWNEPSLGFLTSATLRHTPLSTNKEENKENSNLLDSEQSIESAPEAENSITTTH